MARKTVLLVPQGAEYQAVRRRGTEARQAKHSKPASLAPVTLVPVPMGQAASAGLDRLLAEPPRRAILLGLGGSLSPEHRPGQVVVCESCLEQSSGQRLRCDPATIRALVDSLTRGSGQIAAGSVIQAAGLTSDRVVCSAAEKRRLGKRYGAVVVDMEGYWVLERLQQADTAVGIVRVISDGAEKDIPDLSQALGKDGSLKPVALAGSLGRSPAAALRLIRGSLRGLSVLQQVAAQLRGIN
ncbi:MAG: phosphorylase [Elainellaceae cyanobacterium]